MTSEVTALANGVSQRDGVEGNPEIGVALCIRQRHVDGMFAIKRQPAMCESDSQATDAKTFNIGCTSIYGEALRISETILPTHLSEALRPLDTGEQLAIGAEVIEHRALLCAIPCNPQIAARGDAMVLTMTFAGSIYRSDRATKLINLPGLAVSDGEALQVCGGHRSHDLPHDQPLNTGVAEHGRKNLAGG